MMTYVCGATHFVYPGYDYRDFEKDDMHTSKYITFISKMESPQQEASNVHSSQLQYQRVFFGYEKLIKHESSVFCFSFALFLAGDLGDTGMAHIFQNKIAF